MAAALKDVLAGGAPMHPRVAKMVLETFAKQNVKSQIPQEDYGLSTREKEILEWMVKGLIKKTLRISILTALFGYFVRQPNRKITFGEV